MKEKKTGILYTISSVLSWVIDNLLFNLLQFLLFKLPVGIRLFLSTAIARVLSSIFNFSVNRKAVFKSDTDLKKTFVKYYILWACQLTCSYALVYLVTDVLDLSMVLSGVAKIIIDLALFLVSYQIQKRWVFK